MLDHVNQTSCPVVLTSAWMTPHLMLLDTARDPTANGIDLEFNNISGKEIRLMQFSAQLLVKKSMYDLGYLPPIHVHLTADGTRTLDETFAQFRHLSLPEGIHPTLVQAVTLEQVTFEDGSPGRRPVMSTAVLSRIPCSASPAERLQSSGVPVR